MEKTTSSTSVVSKNATVQLPANRRPHSWVLTAYRT